MKVTYFVALSIMISVGKSQCHEQDEFCKCEISGGFPDPLGTVCCDAKCKVCDSDRYCGHNGGNPGCCSVTILHNHGECTDIGAEAPCIRNEIRVESKGFEFEAGSGFDNANIVDSDGNPITNEVGWQSTGFVVQLYGVVQYSNDDLLIPYLAATENVIGKLTMKGDDYDFGTFFCPIVDQTFAVTNNRGLSVSVIITSKCEVKVASWALHKVFYNADEKQFYHLENFYTKPVIDENTTPVPSYDSHCSEDVTPAPTITDEEDNICTDTIPDNIKIYESPTSEGGGEESDQNIFQEMGYLDLGGVTYIGQYIYYVKMEKDENEGESSSEVAHFIPEINYNLMYGLLILGLILWECRKCYIYQKGNSPYSKVQVHYVDESSQITEIDVEFE